MNLKQECVEQLADVLGSDPNDIIVEIAKVAVADELHSSNNFEGNGVSDYNVNAPLTWACKAFCAPNPRIEIDKYGGGLRVYSGGKDVEGFDADAYHDDWSNLYSSLRSVVLSEANRIYEDAGQFIIDY